MLPLCVTALAGYHIDMDLAFHLNVFIGWAALAYSIGALMILDAYCGDEL